MNHETAARFVSCVLQTPFSHCAHDKKPGARPGPSFFNGCAALLLLLLARLVVTGLRSALVLLRIWSRWGWLLRLGRWDWSICHSMYPFKMNVSTN